MNPSRPIPPYADPLDAQAAAFAQLPGLAPNDMDGAYRQAVSLGDGLFPHQIEGVAFLLGRRRAILADDMGLGKTRQAIVSLRHAAPGGPYLVVCPASVKRNWAREIEQAAEILGASRWRTLFEIVLPLVRSGLVATFLFILILTWSEYLLALIITKTQFTTLPIELSKDQGTTEGRVYGRQAALAVGITVPLMIVGLIIRKHLARGFSFGMVRR